MAETLEVYRKIIKIKINESNPQLVYELFQIREKINEDIIHWTKKFYQLRDSLDYQVLFHMWKENKEEIYKKQMFDLLAKYHLSYNEYKAYIQKNYPKYYEVFYSMNKKIYRRFVDAVLNERSLGYFNEKTRKTQQLLLTPYNKEGGSNLILKKGYIDFETIHLMIDVVDCILLEEYQNKAYTKGYLLKKDGTLEIELIIQDDGIHFDIEYISTHIFKQRLF